MLVQFAAHIFVLVALKLFSRLIIVLFIDYNLKVFNKTNKKNKGLSHDSLKHITKTSLLRPSQISNPNHL